MNKQLTRRNAHRLMKRFAEKHVDIPDPALIAILEDYRLAANAHAGKEVIFKDSVQAAYIAYQMIMDARGGYAGILMMLTQMGKTAAMILMALAFPEVRNHYRQDGKTTAGICAITNKSLRSIFKQNLDRFEEAGFALEIPLDATDQETIAFGSQH